MPASKPRPPRPQTVTARKLRRRQTRRANASRGYRRYRRPRTRGACKTFGRPCPFVGCKYHLMLDVNPTTGSIKVNFPGVELRDMPETCVLDVAERRGATLEEVGLIMNLTRERVRQIEAVAIDRARDAADRDGMELWDYIIEEPLGRGEAAELAGVDLDCVEET